MKSVYSAVRTGALNKAACAPSFKGTQLILHSLVLILHKTRLQND
jgi:hypothetical protein